MQTPAEMQLRDQAARNALAQLARRLLQFYWLTCIAIVALGVNQMHPEWARRVRYALRDPAMDLARPFANCAVAHNAGYFDIPRGSRAYVERQDGDGNGRACEPYPGYPPDRMARLRLIEDRLTAP